MLLSNESSKGKICEGRAEVGSWKDTRHSFLSVFHERELTRLCLLVVSTKLVLINNSIFPMP